MSTQTTPFEVLINWFPMLLLIGVWIFFMSRVGWLRRGRLTNFDYMEQMLQETKRHNEALEKILSRIEPRSSAG
jgi:hypothetical protein